MIKRRRTCQFCEKRRIAVDVGTVEDFPCYLCLECLNRELKLQREEQAEAKRCMDEAARDYQSSAEYGQVLRDAIDCYK